MLLLYVIRAKLFKMHAMRAKRQIMYKNFNIHELRKIARNIGVKCPTSLKKTELIIQIEKIKNGKQQPYFNNGKGRPPIGSLFVPPILGFEIKSYIEQQVKLELQQLVQKFINTLIFLKN